LLTQDKEDNTAGRKTDRKDEAILKWFYYNYTKFFRWIQEYPVLRNHWRTDKYVPMLSVGRDVYIAPH